MGSESSGCQCGSGTAALLRNPRPHGRRAALPPIPPFGIGDAPVTEPAPPISDRARVTYRLDVNVLFHATLLLTLLFLWNWSSKWMSRDSAMMWTVIDAAAVAVLGSTGFRLWNGRCRG